MAVTTTTLSAHIGGKIIVDADADSTVEQALTSGTTIYQIRIDNSNNSNSVFLKIEDAQSGSNQNVPDHMFYCPSQSKVSYVINSGIVLASGLAFYVTTSRAAANTDSPTKDVEVRLLVS
tara:strand:- start:1907 stop:2266 length:360 start_codon:yes stop_codon:yes gene_type:complete